MGDWDKLGRSIDVSERRAGFTAGGLHDLRYALRFFRRNLAFTAIATLTLAFGIGGNTAIFTMVDALVLRGLPYPAPERLMAIETRKAQQPEIEPWTSALDFFDFREQSRAFSSMAGDQPGLERGDDGQGPDGATRRALRFGGILPHARRQRGDGPHLRAGGRPQDAAFECGGAVARFLAAAARRKPRRAGTEPESGRRDLYGDRRAAGGFSLCGGAAGGLGDGDCGVVSHCRPIRSWESARSVRYLESGGAAARRSDGGAGQGRGAAAGVGALERSIRNSIAASSGMRVR